MIFKDCIEAVKKFHPCQIFSKTMRAHLAHVFPVVTVDPFTKLGLDFMTCHPVSIRGHQYIIVVVDYFTKWAEAMSTFANDGETATLFVFNHVIAKFRVLKEIVTDHGSHFQNRMMSELASKLGFRKDHSSPYYPQANGQVEAINKSLKTILKRTVNMSKSNWHLMLYPTTSVKTATCFSPFQFVHGVVVFPIECNIPSLKIAIKLLPYTTELEECLIYSENLDEQCRDAAIANEAHKKHVKTNYDKSVRSRVFSEGDLVFLYDQDKDPLGAGKFNPMWHGLYVLQRVLKKGAYELADYEGNVLLEPINGLYLKKYYA